MNKQIEEMAKILNETCNVYDEQGNHIRNKCGECECWSDDNHCCCSYNSKEAEALYNAGYRKSTNVARNIFGNLRILGYIDFDGNFCIRKDSFEALEKQYESEGAE
jgi:hypothetical protein